jgi:hypothetical protein
MSDMSSTAPQRSGRQRGCSKQPERAATPRQGRKEGRVESGRWRRSDGKLTGGKKMINANTLHSGHFVPVERHAVGVRSGMRTIPSVPVRLGIVSSSPTPDNE